eukprot:sb/3461947/
MESSTVDVNLVDKVRNIGSMTKSSRTVPSSKHSTMKTSEASTTDSSLISDIVIEQEHLTMDWVQKSHEIHSDSSDTRSSSSKSSSEKSKSSTRKSISSTSKLSQSTKVHDDTSSIDKSCSSHASEAVLVKSLYENTSSVPSVQDTSHLSTVDSTESLTMSIEAQLKPADDETDFSETSKGYITESIVSPDNSSFITSSSSRLSSEVSTESSSTRKSAVSEEYSTHTSTSTDDHVSSFSDLEGSSEAGTSTSTGLRTRSQSISSVDSSTDSSTTSQSSGTILSEKSRRSQSSVDTTSQSLTELDSSSAVSSIKVEETRLQEQQPPKVKEMLSESSDTTLSDVSTSASGVSSSTQTYSTSEKVLPVSSQVESLSSVMSEDPSSKETDVIVIKTLSNLGGEECNLINNKSVEDDNASFSESTTPVSLMDSTETKVSTATFSASTETFCFIFVKSYVEIVELVSEIEDSQLKSSETSDDVSWDSDSDSANETTNDIFDRKLSTTTSQPKERFSHAGSTHSITSKEAAILTTKDGSTNSIIDRVLTSLRNLTHYPSLLLEEVSLAEITRLEHTVVTENKESSSDEMCSVTTEPKIPEETTDTDPSSQDLSTQTFCFIFVKAYDCVEERVEELWDSEDSMKSSDSCESIDFVNNVVDRKPSKDIVTQMPENGGAESVFEYNLKNGVTFNGIEFEGPTASVAVDSLCEWLVYEGIPDEDLSTVSQYSSITSTTSQGSLMESFATFSSQDTPYVSSSPYSISSTGDTSSSPPSSPSSLSSSSDNGVTGFEAAPHHENTPSSPPVSSEVQHSSVTSTGQVKVGDLSSNSFGEVDNSSQLSLSRSTTHSESSTTHSERIPADTPVCRLQTREVGCLTMPAHWWILRN